MERYSFDEAYFDRGLNREGTASVKWDVCRRQHGPDALPMWVADMDFASPPAVREALLRRAEHPTYGYTEVTEADLEAPIAFWKRRHQLELDKSAVTLMPCVVTGIRAAIRALTQPGDGVIIQEPLYGPFRRSIELTHRQVMNAPLTQAEDGAWRMDLNAVEECCRHGAKLMMLCSPHNPISRVWTEAELRELMDVLQRWRVPLVADEIHADFIYAPARFVSALSIRREGVMTLCAPSKTFNIAGLQTAYCFCEDEAMRAAMAQALEEGGAVAGNIFGLEAARAAQNEGDAWLDGLVRYLDGTRAMLMEQLPRCVPGAVLSPISATYLAWIDLRKWGMSNDALMRCTGEHGLVCTEGTFFGASGDGWLRLNFGCPRARVTEAVERLAAALR